MSNCMSPLLVLQLFQVNWLTDMITRTRISQIELGNVIALQVQSNLSLNRIYIKLPKLSNLRFPLFYSSNSLYSSNWQLVGAISGPIAFVGGRSAVALDTKISMIDAFLMREMFHKKAFSGQLAPSLSLGHSPSFSQTAFCHIPVVFAVVHHHNGCIASATECCHHGSCNYQVSTWLSLHLSPLPPAPLIATCHFSFNLPSHQISPQFCCVSLIRQMCCLPICWLFPPLFLSLSLTLLWQT